MQDARPTLHSYLSTVDPDLTQPTRAISPIIISSTTQQARIIDITTSGEETDDIQDTGLPPDESMARLKNRTPVGDTLITKLKDPPLFRLCSILGWHRVINVFCNTGNSHCLFTNGT